MILVWLARAVASGLDQELLLWSGAATSGSVEPPLPVHPWPFQATVTWSGRLHLATLGSTIQNLASKAKFASHLIIIGIVRLYLNHIDNFIYLQTS